MARDFEIGRGDDLDVVLPSRDASVVWLVGELGVRAPAPGFFSSKGNRALLAREAEPPG